MISTGNIKENSIFPLDPFDLRCDCLNDQHAVNLRQIPPHLCHLASELTQSDSDFVYNIITAGGIHLLRFLCRAKQACSQSLLIIYVTQIPLKLHLCGLFAFLCQKKLSASAVMV